LHRDYDNAVSDLESRGLSILRKRDSAELAPALRAPICGRARIYLSDFTQIRIYCNADRVPIAPFCAQFRLADPALTA
jgi:hypothetical protein